MDKDTPELLPNERTKMPDPEVVPPTVTTAAAFGGRPLRSKERQDEDSRSGQSEPG
ncbi:hypothetical protein BH23ACT12_BH23ACT12_12680 [soil metagenome]